MPGLFDRLSHLPTTFAGLAVGGIVIYILKSFGCALPSDWLVWVTGIVTALPGLLAKK